MLFCARNIILTLPYSSSRDTINICMEISPSGCLNPCNNLRSSSSFYQVPTHKAPWRIPWTEEPGELQSMGSQRVRHDWATDTFAFKVPILGSWNSPDSLIAKWVLIINTAWPSPVYWAGMTKTILWHKIRLKEAGPMTSIFSAWKQGDNKHIITQYHCWFSRTHSSDDW